jgi:acetyl-CoA synthetase
VRNELDGLPDGKGLNIAYEAVDRHANGPRRGHLALRWLGRDGAVGDFTHGDLQEQSNRFANVLGQLGVDQGERVFVLAGRIPALYITALGTLKNRSVFCPLFSAFGPEPIYQRLSRGDAKVLVTTERLYRQKIAGLRERLPQLQHVLLADVEKDLADGLWSLPQWMAEVSGEFTIPPTSPEDMAILHFTSDRYAKRRDPCARRRADPLHHRQVCAGLPPRRHLLVYRRPRLGHWHVLRHHRAANARRDQHR